MANKFEVDATNGRVYPRTEIKNQVAEFIYWFHVYYQGSAPDATSYSVGTKIIKDLMEPGARKFPGARGYTAREMADLLYYLREKDIELDSISLLRVPNLLRSFVNNNKRVLDSKVEWLSSISSSEVSSWDSPKGW